MSPTFNDLSAMYALTEAERADLAAPVLDALASIPSGHRLTRPVNVLDRSIDANRGRCVYEQAIEGRFTGVQLCAARYFLRQGPAYLAGEACELVRCLPRAAGVHQ